MKPEQHEDDEEVVRRDDSSGLAASAARLRLIVAGNEARMRQLREFVQRLDEMLETISPGNGKAKASPAPPRRVAVADDDEPA